MKDEPDVTRAGQRPPVRRIGPYRIEGELGRGGMGIVHRAFDERLHRPVALKALPDELALDREQLARLEREARAIASIRHPNVAAIHGMEEAQGTTYLVLELVEGETLRERLDRGRLPIDEVLAVCAQVAAGLHAVHRGGLVHRDLKPSNVMVSPDGTAKLLDFGLARRARAPKRGDTTRRGVVVGTPGWMSPEQLRGEEVDERSDAWAWGCLLFECLTGTPAFPGATAADRDAATLARDPDWSALSADVPETVRPLLEACLAKAPADRPATLNEARRRLMAADTASSEARGSARHSLPVERDRFVGRVVDLRELGERLQGGARLVSMLGIGGTGKTRLALHLAHERLGEWPGGAWFCDLSEARSLDGVVLAVARGLDVPLSQSDPVTQLGHAIAGRGRCLILLDNFEQVARHAPETLGRWLDRASDAQFLVTTREVLGLPGETAFALAPLDQDDATALFVRRAEAARRGFAPSAEDHAAIAELVALLDRLPLAIEIAAARARTLSPAGILERMDDRFRLLTTSGGRRDRQATLRATLDWSWDLLLPDEQAALAQLSVFEGGFTLETARAVLELEDLWPEDAVQALVDKSLVHEAGDRRFDLLVSVQEYAALRLQERGDGDAAAQRHGRYFARLGEPEAVAALTRHGGVERTRALITELENLVAACRRAVQRDDAPTAVATLSAAAAAFGLTGPHAVACALAAEVLALESLTTVDRRRALRALGTSLIKSGRLDEARRCCEAEVALAREAGSRQAEGRALTTLASIHVDRGEHDAARPLGERALTLAREQGDRVGESWALSQRATLAATEGRFADARLDGERQLEISRGLGDRLGERSALCNLGRTAMRQGRLDEASALLEAAITACREAGDVHTETGALGNLSNVRAGQGRGEDERALLEQALAIARRTGTRLTEGIFRGNLGAWCQEHGDSAQARAYFSEALAIHREVGFRQGQGHWLRGSSALALQAGDVAEAVALGEQAVEAARGFTDLEASVACDLARARLAAGDMPGAREALDLAERGAREPPRRFEVLCTRAEVLTAELDASGARAALAEAEALAETIGRSAVLGVRSLHAKLQPSLDTLDDETGADGHR